LQNDQFHGLYSTPNIIGAAKTRRVEHVTHKGRKTEDFIVE